MPTKTTALSPLNLDLQGVRWPLYRGGDDVYIRDIDWAERLGFDRPRDIRKLIKRMTESGKLGQVVCATVAQTTCSLGGRPATEYYLTRGQALKVAAKSETAYADELLDQMIQVFLLAIGQAPAPAARALPGKVEPLLFALQQPNGQLGHILHADLLKPGQMQITDQPGLFWRSGCEVWVVSAGTIVSCGDSIIVAEDVRLLRRASAADFASAGVYFTGTHKFADGVHRCISGTYKDRGRVFAYGDAKVQAYGPSIVVHAGERAVVAAEDCRVVARGFAQVLASGGARVFAIEHAMVEARGWADISAADDVQVRARGQVVVRAKPTAVTHLTEQAVRLEYDKKPLLLPRCTMAAAPMQLQAGVQ